MGKTKIIKYSYNAIPLSNKRNKLKKKPTKL